MSEFHSVERRDFVTIVLAGLGSIIAGLVGLPALGYLIDPALRARKSEAWIPLGKLENFEIGKPTLATFTRSKVNGWEKTVSSYGVFVLRKSDAEQFVLSNVCTHLSCRVNWNEEKKQYTCPCHDATFSLEGEVLGGPPPRPLDRFEGEELKIEENVLYLHFAEG
jgi:menaquinol-cytochrome c reductase iron-sulfur subunit